MSRAIRELFKRTIAYHPLIAKAFGSVKLAILWSQIDYWSDKTTHPGGWIYKNRKDLFDETGLSRKELETARRDATKLGVMESKRMGQPCTVHFRINYQRSYEIAAEYLKKNPERRSRKERLNLMNEARHNLGARFSMDRGEIGKGEK